ncbi:MAG TPA: pectate lyase [Rhodocyclaceae bacterium]|nr:pectate lyase [Rhodocyclaceae bacterium]
MLVRDSLTALAVVALLSACGGGGGGGSSSDAGSAPASSSSSSVATSSSNSSSVTRSSSSSTATVISSLGADGWAKVGTNNLSATGTSGGDGADAAHTYTVTNRNELLAALYTGLTINADGSFSGTLDTTKKIVYVAGTISLNVNKTLVENVEADYICASGAAVSYKNASNTTVNTTVSVAYSYNAYKTQYDPNGAWGTAAVDTSGDPLELARICAMNKQKAVVKIKVPSNTSLIGVGSTAKLVRGNLSLAAGSDNIVIRNIAFEDSFDMFPAWDPTDSGGRWNSQYDTISVEGATHVWIDHCEFSDGTNHDKLYPPVFAAPYNMKEMKVQHHDGAIDVGNQSNYVTISNNYVHDHDKTHLVGGSDTVSATNGPTFLKVTMHHNYLKDVTQRLPRVRMGQVHVYNNYFSGQNYPTDSSRDYSFSVALATGQFAKIYAENNSFDIDAASGGSAAVVTNLWSVSYKSDATTINKCLSGTGYTNSSADCVTLFYDNGNSLLNGAAINIQASVTAGYPALGSSTMLWTPLANYSYSADDVALVKAKVMAGAGVGKL